MAQAFLCTIDIKGFALDILETVKGIVVDRFKEWNDATKDEFKGLVLKIMKEEFLSLDNKFSPHPEMDAAWIESQADKLGL